MALLFLKKNIYVENGPPGRRLTVTHSHLVPLIKNPLFVSVESVIVTWERLVTPCNRGDIVRGWYFVNSCFLRSRRTVFTFTEVWEIFSRVSGMGTWCVNALFEGLEDTLERIGVSLLVVGDGLHCMSIT